MAPKSLTPPRNADMKHMEIRYRTYFAVLSVPRPLRPKVGKAKLLKSLQTDDYRVARAQLYPALAELQKRLEPARKLETADQATGGGLLAWREAFAAGLRAAMSSPGLM